MDLEEANRRKYLMWTTGDTDVRYFAFELLRHGIRERDENKSGIMTYRFCNSYPTILGKKLKDVRNAKRAYQ